MRRCYNWLIMKSILYIIQISLHTKLFLLTFYLLKIIMLFSSRVVFSVIYFCILYFCTNYHRNSLIVGFMHNNNT